MFKTRLISGIVLVAIALLTIMAGDYVLLCTLCCVSLIGVSELMRVMKVHKEGYNRLEITAFLAVIVYYILAYIDFDRFGFMAILVSLILLMFVYVFSYPTFKAEEIMAAFFGIVYVGVLLSFVMLTRAMEGGRILVWLIFLSSWGCDTCAYCVGVLFGRHKMAPVLSPKKSVEGAVGGVAGAALLGAIYAAVFGQLIWAYALICAVGALISMVGDLAASAIKRNQGIKDYGTLIPGHGGILDRFDSMIFTAPVIFFMARFVLGL